MKWRSASKVLCDCIIPIKLKGNFYNTVILPAMLYGVKCLGCYKATYSQNESS